jgi:hypothetical protein
VDDPRAKEQFKLVVGKRRTPPAGAPPSRAARAAMAQMGRYRTRVPKGVFIYSSHDDANRDWERWQLEAIALRQSAVKL